MEMRLQQFSALASQQHARFEFNLSSAKLRSGLLCPTGFGLVRVSDSDASSVFELGQRLRQDVVPVRSCATFDAVHLERVAGQGDGHVSFLEARDKRGCSVSWRAHRPPVKDG
jgi:hypothetical protein